MTNAFCDLVGCRLPIQQAGMSRIATPGLAAAVAGAGGLGMLAYNRQPAAFVRAQVEEARSHTDQPIGVSFLVVFLDPDALAAAAEVVPVVELFWGWPDTALVLDHVITGWQVGSVDEARAAADAGCGYVVAQSVEAGGHVRGTETRAELLAGVRAAVQVPIVAAGGIGTAADVRAALEDGADAVRVGTRFVAAVEADTHDGYVDALIAAGPDDTVLTETFSTGWPDAPHRVLASSARAAQAVGPDPVATMVMPDGRVADLPRRGPTAPTRTTTGQIEAMALYAGLGVGAVTARQPAGAIVAELAAGVP